MSNQTYEEREQWRVGRFDFRAMLKQGDAETQYKYWFQGRYIVAVNAERTKNTGGEMPHPSFCCVLKASLLEDNSVKLECTLGDVLVITPKDKSEQIEQRDLLVFNELPAKIASREGITVKELIERETAIWDDHKK